MGLYDTIRAPCPQCGTVSEFQSKSGECLCETFTLEDCPMDVLRGANRHSPNTCEKCGTLFSLDISERRTFTTSESQARCAICNWVDIKNGMPDKQDELVQYLCDSRGIYSVCRVAFDEDENRLYFKDDNYLEVVPDRYMRINF